MPRNLVKKLEIFFGKPKIALFFFLKNMTIVSLFGTYEPRLTMSTFQKISTKFQMQFMT